MNNVAGDALENQREGLLSEAHVELQRQRQSHGHLQEYQQDVQRHVSEVQHEVQSQQVASRTTSRSGASESSAEIQPLRRELDTWLLSVAAWKEQHTDAKVQSICFPRSAQILRVRGMLEVRRQKTNTFRQMVLRMRAEIHDSVVRSKEEVAYVLAATTLGVIMHPRSVRDI